MGNSLAEKKKKAKPEVKRDLIFSSMLREQNHSYLTIKGAAWEVFLSPHLWKCWSRSLSTAFLGCGGKNSSTKKMFELKDLLVVFFFFFPHPWCPGRLYLLSGRYAQRAFHRHKLAVIKPSSPERGKASFFSTSRYLVNYINDDAHIPYRSWENPAESSDINCRKWFVCFKW